MSVPTQCPVCMHQATSIVDMRRHLAVHDVAVMPAPSLPISTTAAFRVMCRMLADGLADTREQPA